MMARSSHQGSPIRKTLFQIHHWLGVSIGVFLLIVGVSGAALVYAPEFESGLPVAGNRATGLPLEAVSEAVLAGYPGYRLHAVRLNDQGNAIELHIKNLERGDLHLMVDPATGAVRRAVNRQAGLWHWLRDLHHNLLAGKTGRKVNGVFGAALLLLVLTGAVLWWPGVPLVWKRLRFQPKAGWKRRNWDLHTVLGMWLAVPLAFFGFTGFQFAFPETADGLIRALTFAPKPEKAPPKAARAATTEFAPPTAASKFIAAAAGAIAGGRVTQIRFPHEPGELVEVRVKTPLDFHWHGHSRVWLRPDTAEVVRFEDFRRLPFGWQVALALRQLHQGHFTAPGGWGMVLRFLWIPLGLLPGLLFLTGFLMWWNRKLAKQWRALRRGSPVVREGGGTIPARLALWALVCIWPAAAQDSVVNGRVLDGTGAVIVGARVTLQTSPARISYSNANGEFSFEHVPAGSFVLTVEAPGFAQASIPVRPGAPAEIRLDPAPVAQVIDVNAGTFDRIRLDEPVFQTGIDRADIATRNNRRLSDVVARMPGVFMSGPPGGDKDVRLRGMDKEFSRTQVDGFMIPDSGEKRELQLNRIPSSTVQSVRIIRNPTAEFESDGLAGRVDVQTRPIPGRLLLEGRIGAGARSSAGGHRVTQGQLTMGQRLHRNFGFMGTFDWLDDVLPISRQFGNPDGSLENDNELQPQRSPNFFGNFGVYTERFGDLHIKPTYLRFSSEKDRLRQVTNAAGLLTRRESETEAKTQETYGLTMNHRYARPSGFILDTQGGWFGTSERKPRAREFFRILPGGAFTLDRTELNPESKGDRTWNFNTAASLPVRALLWQEWKFGGSLRSRGRTRDRDRFEIRPDGRITPRGQPKDRYRISETYSAGFVQNRIRFTDRLSWTPGVRVERVDLTPQSGFSRAAPRTLVDVNPSSHLLFRASDRLSLRAAVSRGLARPKFDELAPYENISATQIVTGNPDLEPARAWNFDAGFEYATRAVTFGVNGFHKRVRGFIEEVATGEFRDGRDVFQVRNSGDGWTQGIEFEQRLRMPRFLPAWARNFSFWSNQTLLDSELTDAFGQRRRFKEQPRWIANFGGDYTDEKFGTSLSVMANLVSRRFEFKTNGDITSYGGNTSIDVALYQRLRGPVRLFLEGNNLTNRDRTRDEIFRLGGVQRRTEIFGRTLLSGVQIVF